VAVSAGREEEAGLRVLKSGDGEESPFVKPLGEKL